MADLPIELKLEICAELPPAIQRATTAVKKAFRHAVDLASTVVRSADVPPDLGRQVERLRTLIDQATRDLFIHRVEYSGLPPLSLPGGFRPDSLLRAVSQQTSWQGIHGRNDAQVCRNFAIHVRDLIEDSGGQQAGNGGRGLPVSAHTYPAIHSWFSQYLNVPNAEADLMVTALDQDEIQAINHGLAALQINAPTFPIALNASWETIVAELRKQHVGPDGSRPEAIAAARRRNYDSLPRSVAPMNRDLRVLNFIATFQSRMPLGTYRHLVTPGTNEADGYARALLLHARNGNYEGVESILLPLLETSEFKPTLLPEIGNAINAIIAQASLEAASAAAMSTIPRPATPDCPSPAESGQNPSVPGAHNATEDELRRQMVAEVRAHSERSKADAVRRTATATEQAGPERHESSEVKTETARSTEVQATAEPEAQVQRAETEPALETKEMPVEPSLEEIPNQDLEPYLRGPMTRKEKVARRNQLIDQAMRAGITTEDKIFDFVKQEDPTLVFANKTGGREITSKSMMLAYERARAPR
jgi:hypothetical protein